MCIDCVSNNLYPFNQKPSSILASSALLLSIVTGVLAGIAYIMQWGTPALSLLTVTSAILTIITIALITIPEISRKKKQAEEEKKLQEENGRKCMASKLPPPIATSTSQLNETAQMVMIAHQLLVDVRSSDTKQFAQVIKPYDQGSFTKIFLDQFCVEVVESDDKVSLPANRSYSLFQYILRLKDTVAKREFLEAVIPKLSRVPILIYDHTTKQLSSEMVDDYLVIQDKACIKHLINEAENRRACNAVIAQAVDRVPPDGICKLWTEVMRELNHK